MSCGKRGASRRAPAARPPPLPSGRVVHHRRHRSRPRRRSRRRRRPTGCARPLHHRHQRVGGAEVDADRPRGPGRTGRLDPRLARLEDLEQRLSHDRRSPAPGLRRRARRARHLVQEAIEVAHRHQLARGRDPGPAGCGSQRRAHRLPSPPACARAPRPPALPPGPRHPRPRASSSASRSSITSISSSCGTGTRFCFDPSAARRCVALLAAHLDAGQRQQVLRPPHRIAQRLPGLVQLHASAPATPAGRARPPARTGRGAAAGSAPGSAARAPPGRASNAARHAQHLEVRRPRRRAAGSRRSGRRTASAPAAFSHDQQITTLAETLRTGRSRRSRRCPWHWGSPT